MNFPIKLKIKPIGPVRDLQNEFLPDEGAIVDANSFWYTKVRNGDVELLEEIHPKKEKKSKDIPVEHEAQKEIPVEENERRSNKKKKRKSK